MLQLLGLLAQITPVLLTLFLNDRKRRQEAMSRFEDWVKAHQADGNQSATLRQSAQDQSEDLRARAAAREEAARKLAEAQAHPASTPAPVNPAPANVAASEAPQVRTTPPIPSPKVP